MGTRTEIWDGTGRWSDGICTEKNFQNGGKRVGMVNYKLKITHLCVGLGLSVLIELNYTHPINGDRHYVGLLDCGSITGGSTFYEPALQKIITAVNNNGGIIDYLHISHFDEDHYNKLGKLAQLYQSAYRVRITVRKLFFGCTGDKDSAYIAGKMRQFFIVNNLYELTNNYFFRNGNIYFCPPPDHPVACLYENIELDNHLYFRICPILYHAHLLPAAYGLTDINIQDAGVRINTGSSVLLATIVKEQEGTVTPYVSYIFTGDATLETMKILQKITGLVFGQENKLILISHHGAKRHVADDEYTNNYTTLRAFLDRVRPAGAVVSAKCKNQNGWTHPHSDTMDVYADYVYKIPDFVQNLTGFYWDNANGGMVVRQGITDGMFYQTFRLNGTVQNGALYRNCSNSSYERIDVEMTNDSTDPINFSLSEYRR